MKGIVVGVDYNKQDHLWSIEDSLEECFELAKTAHIDVINTFSQRLDHPNRTSYIGKGKVEEVKTFIDEHDVKCIIIDDDITPAQSKFLENALCVKVIDRSGLILDIFAQRAQTYEAQLQVECAQLNYVLPRLTRMWTHLSRLGGGIGTRGPGEKQLEVDKRQISARLTHIKKKLNKVQQDRKNRRSPRSLLPLITGAIVGYTNAGKSTLMRRLTDADVFVEDKLFATLDPTTKKVQLPDKTQLVLTDTVGFIQKLPTHLINAFFSTLEEASESDFLIHVVDASHPNLCNIIETSNNIITQLGAHEKPMIYIFNKWDKVAKPNTIKSKIKDFHPQLCISIKNSQDLSTIYDIIIDVLAKFKKKMSFFIPYHRMDIVHLLHQYGDVLHVNYTEHIEMDVDLNEILGKKIMSQLYKEEK